MAGGLSARTHLSDAVAPESVVGLNCVPVHDRVACVSWLIIRLHHQEFTLVK